MLMRTPARWTRPTRRAPPGFILPAQPVLALKPPVGPGWLFGVKHDGFRIVARKEGDGVHLWSRNGRDWSVEFSGITAALKKLEAQELRPRGVRLRRKRLARFQRFARGRSVRHSLLLRLRPTAA